MIARTLVLALVLASAGPGGRVQASDLARNARFSALHGGADALEIDRAERGGLTITGEKIQLDNGDFTATIAQVGHPAFVMQGVSAKGRMPLDAAFFADAITAAVNNVLETSTVDIASFKNARSDAEIAAITLKEIHLVHAHRALTGSLKAVIVHPEFRAHSAYDKATRRLTVTVESVKIAGVGVPLSVAFFTMGQFMNYPFVTLANPNVVIDLKPFLPPPGR